MPTALILIGYDSLTASREVLYQLDLLFILSERGPLAAPFRIRSPSARKEDKVATESLVA